MKYDPKDKLSILEYAQKLKGKTLRRYVVSDDFEFEGKGRFGQILEKYYFGYEINSDARPDFPEAGIELKSSPLKQLADRSYRAKERLVLNIINYCKLADQNFENSDFWKKNSNLLLIFYLYKSHLNLLDYPIKLVDLWTFPEEDLEIIKADWHMIREKVKSGNAHQLSEGDTFYLGACTKGATAATSLREQPNNNIKAKQRAFSLKPKYVNHIIAKIAGSQNTKYGKLIDSVETIVKNNGLLESLVLSKFKDHIGKTDSTLAEEFGFSVTKQPKQFHFMLTKAILGIDITQEIEEFEKADITIKTVRLDRNGLPKEHISFPKFKYTEIVNQTWDDSDFKDMLEHKFFFVFYQYDDENNLKLKKVKFWNMPHFDITKAEKVWNKTRELIEAGHIIKSIDENGRRTTYFPKPSDTSEESVCHVRPHAKNAADTDALPASRSINRQKTLYKTLFLAQ